MASRTALVTGLAFAALPFWGCAPEVLLARSDQQGGLGGQPLGGLGGNPGGSAGTENALAGGAGEAGEAGASEGGSGDVPLPALRVLADSVADFSLTQGERGWSYGYDNGDVATFALLTRISVITAYVPPSGDVWDCWVTEEPHWTQLFQLGGHPNGVDSSVPSSPVLERAVRRWTSNYAGAVRISGELAKIDVTVGGSNGIDASIVLDGVELLYTTFVGGEDGGGLSYDVTATLALGSTVDFVLDPHESSDHHDLTRFTAIIELAADTRGL